MSSIFVSFFVFFFQAEDGIRDHCVTGVQTCALPIFKKELAIALKYYAGRPVIERLERVSKPGLRVYKGRNDIPRVMNGLGVAILSTSRGVMTDRKARADGVRGEVLCIRA